ncbi:hypothetical protein BGZ76_004856 [Entomortierella beljakovae]|nr:hypothetical protein BGZ76_004856 [Entomortierella beljakovae]
MAHHIKVFSQLNLTKEETEEWMLQLSESFVSRRWTLARFYVTQLRSLANPLFRNILGSGSDSADCRGLLRYVLFFMRSRLISSDVIINKYPEIQAEIVKFVTVIEETIVSALISQEKAYDEYKRSIIHEFALASGPRVAFGITEPLSNFEWNMGRLKFLLKIISIFDEFSPNLQLQLYPTHETSGSESIISGIIECVNTAGLLEFGAVRVEGSGQENGDLYFRILSDLCTFAFLLQPKQFAKMEVDMIGLVLGQSKLWSLIAEDWWTCISHKLGQEFIEMQAGVLMNLLVSLPTGITSQKVGGLIACIIPLLDEQSQLKLTRKMTEIIDSETHQYIQTLLIYFPYECLSSSSECQLSISDDVRACLVSWSVEIIGGAFELLLLVKDDKGALNKVSRTVSDLVVFLQVMQPIQSSELIQVLDTIISWDSLPLEKRPLSKISVARFLSSCSDINIPESQLLCILMTCIGQNEVYTANSV